MRVYAKQIKTVYFEASEGASLEELKELYSKLDPADLTDATIEFVTDDGTKLGEFDE